MEFSKPVKSALSIGKFTYDMKANMRNKITFSASPPNDTNHNRKKYTEAKEREKFSSTGKFNQSIPNCIQSLRYVTRKPVISSQMIPTHYMDNSLSHMPVYHKVYFETWLKRINYHITKCSDKLRSYNFLLSLTDFGLFQEYSNNWFRRRFHLWRCV